jgi:hypothetical protein
VKHALLNPEFGPVQTVVVLGVGRGGTSCVAGTLRALGICMGEDPHPLKHEWSPVAYSDTEVLLADVTAGNIGHMNEKHVIWGWKSPRDIFALDQILALLRRPGFVMVTRDITEVALSGNSYMGIPLDLVLYEAAAVYNVITDRLRLWPCPALIVPFGELKMYPADFVELLCRLLQIDPTGASKDAATEFIGNGPNAYRAIDRPGGAISDADLQADTSALIPVLVRRYSSDYLGRFARLVPDARQAIALLVAPSELVAGASVANEVAVRVAAVVGSFRAILDAQKATAADAGQQSNTTGARNSLRDSIGELEHLADSAAAELARHEYNPPDGYEALTRVRQLLQTLILVRIELQKGLERLRLLRTTQPAQV